MGWGGPWEQLITLFMTWTGCPDADGLKNFTMYFLISFRLCKLPAQKRKTIVEKEYRPQVQAASMYIPSGPPSCCPGLV